MAQANSKTKYLIKIAITGPEASGKSELAAALAKYYNTAYAPEYARKYLENKNGQYSFQDLDKIALGQIKNEELAVKRAREICFFDTDMLVMYVWSSFRFGKVSPLIKKALSQREYDHWLLCKPDLPWEEDPLRESPNQKEREELFQIYEDYLKLNFPSQFTIVEGLGANRLNTAISAIEDLQ